MMASGKMALAVMNDRVVTIEDLARRHRVSKNHLMKVAQTLVRLGLVRSMRGRAGGLMLARDPAEIRMGAVVRALEEEMQLVSCLGEGPATCVLIGPGDCRKIGGAPASWAFSCPFSDQGWMRGLDFEVGENRG